MKVLKNALPLMAFLILFLSVAATAMAADWGEIRTPTRPLNIRAERTKNSKKVDTIKPGEQVRVDYLKDDWFAVFDPAEEIREESRALGYSKATYLTPVEAKADWGQYVYAEVMLNVREGRGPKYEHVRTLYPGDVVKVDYLVGDWYAVFELDEVERSQSKAIGYSKAKYLKPASETRIAKARQKPVDNPAPIADSAPVKVEQSRKAEPPRKSQSISKSDNPEDWGKLVRITSKVNIRDGRTAEAGQVRTLQPGEIIKVGLLEKNWYAVFDPDVKTEDESKANGFVYKTLLDNTSESADTPESVPEVEQFPEPEAVTVDTEAQPDPDDLIVKHVDVRPAYEINPVESSYEPIEDEPLPVASTQMPPVSDDSDDDVSYERLDQPSSQPNRPEPVADQLRHGYKFAIMDRIDNDRGPTRLIIIKVFLDVTRLPDTDSLRDFVTTIWKEERRGDSEMIVEVFFPGMNLKDLSYAKGEFDGTGLLEYWERATVLHGTALAP